MWPYNDVYETREDHIAKARHLDFWLYGFSYQPLQKLFQKMARVWIPIRGIMENEPYGWTTKEFTKLQKLFTWRDFIDLHTDELLRDNFMHAKTFLTDNAFIIQTANLSYSSFFNNREFFFLSYDPTILANLQMLFDKDRIGETIQPDEIDPNLLICPIDCRYKIEMILSGARESIWMYQQYIQDESIMSMLMQKSWLDLKFIVADNSSKGELEASPLDQFTHFWKKPYVHAKMILVDDTYLIVSSINMSANSMDMNREIGIIIIDSFLIEEFRRQFERDWGK